MITVEGLVLHESTVLRPRQDIVKPAIGPVRAIGPKCLATNQRFDDAKIDKVVAPNARLTVVAGALVARAEENNKVALAQGIAHIRATHSPRGPPHISEKVLSREERWIVAPVPEILVVSIEECAKQLIRTSYTLGQTPSCLRLVSVRTAIGADVSLQFSPPKAR